MTTAALHSLFVKHPTVCTDTRKITEGCIFFALKGDNFNGNKFAEAALEKGAAYAVIDERAYVKNEQTILVSDVLDALQQLAKYHRLENKAEIIALTGSNGKTTTKELINAVLETTHNTIATIGNLNNHIGVPLTLLRITSETEIAIVEMGANHKKEIEFLCSLAQPDFGYITNFGKAHLEGFGGVEGVIEGKSEMYDYLTSNNKNVFLNADDPIQITKLENYISKYGFSETKSQYYNIGLVNANPFVKISFNNAVVSTKLIGRYNFTNCCAAIVMGKYFNVSEPNIKLALEQYTPKNNRSEIISKNGYEIILDAYNANPTSMEAALQNFKQLQSGHKTAILGDMFELGESAEQEHQHIAELAEKMGFNKLIVVGENFKKTTTNALQFPSFESFAEYLKANTIDKGALLIKGSRGMALERVLNLL